MFLCVRLSGEAENLVDWKERSDEDFAFYGGKHGDMLAWIYMLDKSIAFPFNAINNKAPSSTVLEDGTNDSGRKKGRRLAGGIIMDNLPSYIQMQQEVMQHFKSRMEKGYEIIVGFAEQAQRRDEDDNEMEIMHTAVIVIEKLEMKIELLKREISHRKVEDEDNEHCKAESLKLATLEKSLAKTYKALDDE